VVHCTAWATAGELETTKAAVISGRAMSIARKAVAAAVSFFTGRA
jgi:hypothetical protein